MDPLTWIFLILLYVFVGNVIANRFYYPRRCGVRGRIGWGWRASTAESGWISALCVSITWPIAIFLPSVRDPEPCTHRNHVLARQQARQEDEHIEETLRQAKGGG